MDRRLIMVMGLAVVTAVAIGGAVYRPSGRSAGPAAPVTSSPSMDKAEVAHIDQVRPASAEVSASPPPEPLQDFFTWSPRRQLDEVTRLQSDPHLDVEVVSFLLQEVRDPRLDAVTRNNIANALLAQERPEPALATVFARMARDPGESLLWREYAVQHLALSIGSSPDPASFIADLRDLVRHGPESLPGTALIALHRLEGTGGAVLDEAFLAEIAGKLASRTAHPMCQMALLSVVGERRLVAYAPLIRQFVQSEQPCVRRVAIAQLGCLADPADRPVIEGHMRDGDPLVALAAKSALATLDATGATHAP